MVTHHPEIPFERFADDILCHCGSESQAQALKSSLERRFAECGLELHPTKTKIVYCKDDDRRECRSQLRAIRAPATLDLGELGNDLPVAAVEVVGDSGVLIVPIAALGGLGAAIDFCLGKGGQKRVKTWLEEQWYRFHEVNWHNFSEKEARYS